MKPETYVGSGILALTRRYPKWHIEHLTTDIEFCHDSAEYLRSRELSNGALEDEIATRAAHIAAAEYRFLCLVAELDRRRVWAAHGLRSVALLVGMALWCGPERGAREGARGAGP